MKKNYFLALLGLVISSCGNVDASNNSSSANMISSNEISKSDVLSSIENSSEKLEISSSQESFLDSTNISIESSSEILSDDSSEYIESSVSIEESTSNISSDTSESSSENNLVDVSDKEYYKSLVNRDNISYSPKFVNDENHDVTALEIFQINDTHGAFYEENNVAGIARVQTCIKQNSVDPYSVVKIANGDLMQGSAFSNMLLGEPAIASLNEMQFDCFVIGNHEFDWGLDNLSVYKDGNLENGELDCPFLGANIVDENGNRPDWLEPYTIVKKGNVSVGIIGVIGDGLESSISKLSLGNYHFASTEETVNKYCKILQDENVDVIILASHNHDEYVNQTYVDVNKIDCIINGHDHQRIEESVTRYDGKIIPVIESNTKNITVGKVTLQLDNNKKMKSYTMKHYYASNFESDSNLDAIINEYHKVTNDYQSAVIGYHSGGFSKSEIAITSCNYVAYKYDADLAFVNAAGVRANINTSNITNANIYEVFPFDNELYIATISGNELLKMIGNNEMIYYYYNNNTDISNGTEYLRSKITGSKMYKVITVDYVATKDYMTPYFNDFHGLIMTGDYIRNCAIENIQQNYKKK